MNEKCKKNNILDKRKVLSIVITSVVMIPFVISQYLSPFGSSLKYRFDNLPIYKFICYQPFALTNDGYVIMHSGPRYGFLGDLQELITASIFLLLILLVYFFISKSLYFYFKKKELEERKFYKC